IGKNDLGNLTGITNVKKLMEDIPNKIRNHLGIICDVNLHSESDKYFIEIDVKTYNVPISYQGKYYYRSGSTKQELIGSALTDFLLRKSGKTWDDVIEPKANLMDIDSKAIESFKKGAIKSKRLSFIADETDVKSILVNLRLLDDNKLKRASLLLFGIDPRDYFPNAYIKIGKFGISDSDLQFQDIVESNAFELPDRTIELLEKKYLKSPISYNGLHRIEKSEYPFEAIREMLLNAVVHRNYMGAPIQVSVYDDKIIVWNEGTLPEGLTVEDLKRKHPSRPQNPLLADICFKGGLIEAWGRGTLKIIEECKLAGLPEPEIQLVGGGISVTIFKDFYNIDYLKVIGLNDRQLIAIVHLKHNRRISNKDYQKINNCSRNTATADLANLVEKHIILYNGQKGAGAFYTIK
ncbi:transcriptional regulator, partial [Patescibacteria group bacterium]|nr:transcriptional regulator [Patescibacteria group bacterium]